MTVLKLSSISQESAILVARSRAMESFEMAILSEASINTTLINKRQSELILHFGYFHLHAY